MMLDTQVRRQSNSDDQQLSKVDTAHLDRIGIQLALMTEELNKLSAGASAIESHIEELSRLHRSLDEMQTEVALTITGFMQRLREVHDSRTCLSDMVEDVAHMVDRIATAVD